MELRLDEVAAPARVSREEASEYLTALVVIAEDVSYMTG